MAAALGVHPLTILRWEADRYRPRGRALLAYVELLEVLKAEVAA